MTKERKSIPKDVSRRLLIEAGFKCSVPQCSVQWPTLQFHHIDENPANNCLENILLLCPTHHQMVTSKHIDRKTCEILKNLLRVTSETNILSDVLSKNKLMFALIAELHANLMLFSDQSFYNFNGHQVYPRFRHNVLDQVIASGNFIYDLDRQLFSMLYDWSVSLDDINKRLDITELREFGRLPPEEIVKIRLQLVKTPGFIGSQNRCRELLRSLIENYGEELGIDLETELFGKAIKEVLKG
ncbi:MAG: hypothetical protein Kow00121_56610 [Elainellaceae cyanobacterium]